MICPSKTMTALLLGTALLTGCAQPDLPPEIAYDASVPALPPAPEPAAEQAPRPLHTPPRWTPSRSGAAADPPAAQVQNANAAARVEPRQAGYYNAIQVFPYSQGALYQVYTQPGQITDIALEPGERLTGAGPIAAGDTARWIIGDTETGSGSEARVHILVKPTRAVISTNLVIGTNRRSYLLELRSTGDLYIPAVAWSYPDRPRGVSRPTIRRPVIPAEARRLYRYGLRVTGDAPAWRPASVFDDRRCVYIVFPPGIVQGEMPPIFVIGADGEPEIVNTRIHGNVLIVDRLFGAAELRLGSGDRQQEVRIERLDGRPRVTPTRTAQAGGGHD